MTVALSILRVREPFGVCARSSRTTADVHRREAASAARGWQHGRSLIAAAGATVGVPDDGACFRRRAVKAAQKPNVVTGGVCGAALVAHSLISSIALIGSVLTGRDAACAARPSG